LSPSRMAAGESRHDLVLRRETTQPLANLSLALNLSPGSTSDPSALFHSPRISSSDHQYEVCQRLPKPHSAAGAETETLLTRLRFLAWRHSYPLRHLHLP
jgi:hypothetical protein